MPPLSDHVSDVNGEELSRLSKLYEFPDFVKKANMDQVFRPNDLAVTVYADPIRKQFPCHNAASTWLSTVYFTEKKAEFHPKDQVRIKQRLDHYVGYWRIKESVDKYMVKHAEYNKDAEAGLPDSSYAFVWTDNETGRKDRHLRMVNAREVKAAADYLHEYADRFTFRDRNTIAKKILTKAASFGAAVGNRIEFLEKQAGHGVCDPDEVVAMLTDRAKLATLPALKDQILKLAHIVKTQPRQALTPDMMVKLAETVDQIDRTIGLAGKYTDKLPRPEDVIFKATFSKAASDIAEHCALTSGNIYKKADFAKIALDDVRSLFGTDFAEEVKAGLDKVDPEKMAELVHTLPRPDAELFDRLMSDSGVFPQMNKAASAKQGFSAQELAALAAGY